jgi:tetratricopeptide (TPR) repeat protein
MIQRPAERAWVRRTIAVVLFVGTVLLFSRTLANDFVNYDDPDYVTSNGHVKAGLNVSGVRWAFRSHEASNWHPLTWVSHMLDWSLFGPKPRGHHATSILLHALTAVLVFEVFRRLTAAMWTSALLAALFAWHPLRVESVAWVAERKDVLSGLFWFVTLWAYGEYASRSRMGGATPKKQPGLFYGLALVAFALGLMAKPMLVTLPCVLLLLDVWPLGRCADGPGLGARGASLLKLAIEKLPFFALVIGSSVATYVAQKAGGSVSIALGLEARFANAIVAVVRYLGKFFWPVDLAVLYPHPGAWPARTVAACALILFAISALAWRQRRRRPWIGIGWLWFLGTLVPVIGLVQVGLQAIADRYTYLPILGVQIALLWTLREAVPSPGARRGWIALGAGLLAACGVLTWRQIGVWKNSFTLFDHAIRVTHDNYVAHDNRGLFLFKAGKIEEAMADYRRALAINPAYLNANNNLGYALAQQGRPAEAIPCYRAALRANPNHLEVRNNLANALSDVGQLPEAMEHYDFVLARDPHHANALNGSAVALAMQNRLPEAKLRLEHSLQVAPDNASAHNNLGNVCSMLGEPDEALRHYRRAAELNPSDANAFMLIGTLLLQKEKLADAALSFERAIALQPANAEAQAQLGLAYARLGRRDEALRALRTALQQRPEHAQAKAWLEAVLAMPPK